MTQPHAVPGARQLIDARGGFRVVARALGWPATTVHTYCRTDKAPRHRWDAIAALPPVRTPQEEVAGAAP
jgi:hypothetical protein